MLDPGRARTVGRRWLDMWRNRTRGIIQPSTMILWLRHTCLVPHTRVRFRRCATRPLPYKRYAPRCAPHFPPHTPHLTPHPPHPAHTSPSTHHTLHYPHTHFFFFSHTPSHHTGVVAVEPCLCGREGEGEEELAQTRSISSLNTYHTLTPHYTHTQKERQPGPHTP